MIQEMPKHCIIKLSQDFVSHEFDCPCQRCDRTLISQNLVDLLQKLRALTNFPIKIDSGYRCHSHQEELKALGYETAAGVSSHEVGLAADVACGAFSGTLLADLAKKAGFQNIGTAANWIHVDVRPGGPRSWAYTKR